MLGLGIGDRWFIEKEKGFGEEYFDREWGNIGFEWREGSFIREGGYIEIGVEIKRGWDKVIKDGLDRLEWVNGEKWEDREKWEEFKIEIEIGIRELGVILEVGDIDLGTDVRKRKWVLEERVGFLEKDLRERKRL
jgi:hypothetical protein